MNVVERIEEATGPSLRDISKRSPSEIAHTAHAAAYDRVDRLAMELRSAFDKLFKAESELKKLGIEVNVTLPFPISEAWFDWRAKQVLKK